MTPICLRVLRLTKLQTLEISFKSLTPSIILGNVYRPPRDKNEDVKKLLDEYCETLSKIPDSRRDKILVGDFNLDLFTAGINKITPWITSGISESIKCKDTLYKRLHCRNP